MTIFKNMLRIYVIVYEVCYQLIFNHLRREELAMTDIELNAIAAAANIGLSNPNAAIGMPPEL
jgi:hypothetical protein